MAPSFFSPFLDRLSLPQPALQRAAVRSIFAHFKRAPSHEQPSSALGEETLTVCLTHRSPAVVDETAQQLVRLVSERPDLVGSAKGVDLLLAGLREVPAGGVGPIVGAIGAILRLSLAESWGNARPPTLEETAAQNEEDQLNFATGISFFDRQPKSSDGVVVARANASESFASPSAQASGEQHPFYRATLLRDECQEPVLRQVAILLTQAGTSGHEIEALLHLRSFITSVLLHGAGGEFFRRRLTSALVGIAASSGPGLAGPILELLIWHAGLMRIGTYGVQMGSGDNRTGLQESVAISAAFAEDLADLIQHLKEKAGQQAGANPFSNQRFLHGIKANAFRLLGALLNAAFEAQGADLSSLPFLNTIARLVVLLPPVVSIQLLPVWGWLLSRAQIEQEQLSILRLLSRALESSAGHKPSSPPDGKATETEPLVATSVLPILQLLALPSGLIRNHAVTALDKVEEIMASPKAERQVAAGGTTGESPVKGDPLTELWLISGEAKLVSCLKTLVASLWTGAHVPGFSGELKSFPSSAAAASPTPDSLDGTVSWLAALGAHLETLPPQKQGSKSLQEGERTPLGDLVRIAFYVGGALMMHPEAYVRAESAKVLGAAARVDPVQAVPLLPAVLWWLRREETVAQQAASPAVQGKPRASHSVQLSLLSILPSLGAHLATVGPVLKSLQPMLEPTAELPLRAVGLRLLSQLWANLDRSFPRLQAVLMAGVSLPKPSQTLPKPGSEREGIYVANRPSGQLRKGRDSADLEWNMARAASIRGVCGKDAARGVELVLGIQAAIQDPNPVVSALGLESLEVLCEDDAIDFYTAWRVVRRTFPTLPDDPRVAARWASLLAHGALDARAEPDLAAEVLSLLLEAAKAGGPSEKGDRWWRVRSAAVASLSAYAFEAVQEVSPRPLSDYVSLLLTETHSDVRAACEGLVVKALQFEHSTRRRNVPEARALPPTASPALELLQAVPNLVASGPRERVKRAAAVDLPAASSFPGAVLYCYRPLPPTPPEEGKANRVALTEYKEAVRNWAAGFAQVFQEASQSLPGSSPTDQTQLLTSLSTWSRFIPTWLQALALALSVENDVSKAEGVGLAAKEIWSTIQALITEGIPRAAENATLAAAGLCSALHGNASGNLAVSVTSFLAKRLGQVAGHDWAERATAVALGAATGSLPITAREQKGLAVEALLGVYLSDDVSSGALFAAGLALGLVAQSLSHRGADEPTLAADVTSQTGGESVLVKRILRSFSTALWSGVGNETAREIVRRLAATWQVEVVPRQQVDEWAATGAIAGLSQMCSRGRLPGVLSNPGSISGLLNLVDNLTGADRTQSGGSADPVLIAALLALPVLTPLAHRLELVSSSKAEQRLERLSVILQQPSEYTGAIFPAAALSGGSLLDSLLSDGCPLSTATVDKMLDSLDLSSGGSGSGGAYRVGSLLGLANALGAGFGGLGTRTAAAGSGRVLDDERRVAQARAVVQKMIKAVKEDPDPKVQRQAAWALAALYDSRFGGGVSSRGAAPGAENAPLRRALPGLPEEGAMRPLLTYLLTFAEGPGSDGGAVGQSASEPTQTAEHRISSERHSLSTGSDGVTSATAAAVLRCLAKAPRLPALNWGVLFRRLFRAEHQGGTPRESRAAENPDGTTRGLRRADNQRETPRDSQAAAVRRECLRVAIAHGREVPTLAVFLDNTCQLARLVTLETDLQILIAETPAALLRALPRSAGLRVLGDLQDLALGYGFAEEGSGLRAALWRGLGEALEGDGASVSEDGEGNEVRAAVLEAVRSVYRTLPVDVGSFRGARTLEKPGGNSRGAGENRRGSNPWGAAIESLAKTDRAWLLELLKLPSSSQQQYISGEALEVPAEELVSQFRAVIARILLANSSHLPLADLKPCRKWLLEQLDWGQKPSQPSLSGSHARSLASQENPGASNRGETSIPGSGGSLNALREGGYGVADLEGGVEELVAVVAATGGAQKWEWFTETLDWTLLTWRPLQGLTFLALLCNAWLPSTSPFLPSAPVETLANLPYTLPAVLADPDFESDLPAVIQRLVSILTKGDAHVRRILLPCLVGCREKLSIDTWQFVADLAVAQSVTRN
ncbi:ARM repeat superfamily protein [Klebsormidium nitens]|uniref:ARM repeat superfamily protein n=1 Tax=Klebsormidium nitens TaxID=105231 RepID=A0A1Y1IAN5_KLENI|nr:ARM repeat superfamily protein [Klebsormidium nitens]|eukprot:GAQ88025.1 ARM repeat superfamily protein [Klebsormidium nitens]